MSFNSVLHQGCFNYFQFFAFPKPARILNEIVFNPIDWFGGGIFFFFFLLDSNCPMQSQFLAGVAKI